MQKPKCVPHGQNCWQLCRIFFFFQKSFSLSLFCVMTEIKQPQCGSLRVCTDKKVANFECRGRQIDRYQEGPGDLQMFELGWYSGWIKASGTMHEPDASGRGEGVTWLELILTDWSNSQGHFLVSNSWMWVGGLFLEERVSWSAYTKETLQKTWGYFFFLMEWVYKNVLLDVKQ